MPPPSTALLKSYFQTGLVPTQAQFAELIEGMYDVYRDAYTLAASAVVAASAIPIQRSVLLTCTHERTVWGEASDKTLWELSAINTGTGTVTNLTETTMGPHMDDYNVFDLVRVGFSVPITLNQSTIPHAQIGFQPTSVDPLGYWAEWRIRVFYESAYWETNKPRYGDRLYWGIV